ncbi:MAG TPA: right-handed parallel beta-helix repeat-containing protein [Myxococcota bacterium]|nr:right-handed parallel beta-helix repeat-containing protein [Myxococcota bacterium]
MIRLRDILFLSLMISGALVLAGCSGSVAAKLDGSDAQVPDGDAGSDALDAGYDGSDNGTDADDLDGGDSGSDAGGDIGTDAGGDPGVTYGAEFFIATDGDDGNPGTQDSPFATLERARTAVRDLKTSSGLPANGVVVWLLGGVYERSATFELEAEDSGEQDRPVVYRAWPGDEVRIVGAARLRPEWFALVADGDPVFDRVDALARGNLLQVDLAAHAISDYGTLRPRGFGGSGDAAMELFFDTRPMQLGRWPDKDANDQSQTYMDDNITLFGHPQPDVSGSYTKNGTSDGVNSYARVDLVDGKQYNLYRYNWDYQGQNYTAWFITTDTGGYPSNTDPWWHLYNADLGEFDPSNGAQGNPTIIDPQRINHGFVRIDSALDDTSFTYLGDRPLRWSQADEIWLHGYWMHMWADRHVKVDNIDTGAKTVTLIEKPGYGIKAGQPFYTYNLLEEITQPGEWYLDRLSGKLYFWPPAEISSGETYVSMMEAPLVGLSDTRWVVFQDITFEMGRSVLVKIDGGSDNLLQGCKARNAGTDAAGISGANNGLDHCELYDTGDRGVSLSGGDRAGLAPAGNYVTNCRIHNFGRWSWTYKPGVSIGRGVGCRVANNLMHDAPHSAILYSGNEHLIELNDIHDVCRFSSDAGAIYAGRDWGWRGNLIRHNFIHHISSWFEGYGVHGVYMDDCLSGIHVFGNIFYEVTGHAVLNGGGRDNIVENNIMAHCGSAMSADSRGIQAINNTPGDSWNMLERLAADGVHYQQEPWASRYPLLAAIPNDWNVISDSNALWLYPQGCVFSRNLGWDNTSWVREGNYGGTGTLDKYAEMIDNIEDQEPKFQDEAGGDLSLRPDSPAFTIPGFQDIPFDQIGIRP